MTDDRGIIVYLDDRRECVDVEPIVKEEEPSYIRVRPRKTVKLYQPFDPDKDFEDRKRRERWALSVMLLVLLIGSFVILIS